MKFSRVLILEESDFDKPTWAAKGTTIDVIFVPKSVENYTETEAWEAIYPTLRAGTGKILFYEASSPLVNIL